MFSLQCCAGADEPREDALDVEEKPGSVRILQWNVFEDGLSETPANLGFSPEFESDFTSLLQTLSLNAKGEAFWGFSKARDYTQLPPIKHISTCGDFFRFIDLVYSVMYHPLGGEARFGEAPPGAAPDLHNTLRCLFLRSTLPDPSKPPCSWKNPWIVPEFEHQMGIISAPEAADERLRKMKGVVFDASHGSLTWERVDIDGLLWKRADNIWKLWQREFRVFRDPPGEPDPHARAALARFVQFTEDRSGTAVVEDCMRRTSKTSHIHSEERPEALVSVVTDAQGTTLRIRTFTLQSSVYWLLLHMMKHSMDNPDADCAIRAFASAGSTSRPASPASHSAPESPDSRSASPPAPMDTAQARADLVFPRVLQAIETWMTSATLTVRHAKFCQKLTEVLPHITTAVEYDGQWRKLKLPARHYDVTWGAGTAAVFFDTGMFERLDEFEGMPVRESVDAIEIDSWTNQGTKKTVKPKSSCVTMLRRRCDDALFLVVAAHLESSPPSDTYKTRLRALQLRALLQHLAALARRVREAGDSCTLVVGGDFNALLEEFVYGTEDEFWRSEGVLAIQPPLRQPLDKSNRCPVPDPPIARFGPDRRIHLLCDAADGGELRQASHHEMLGCTRAGSNMVIDFIFVGSAGGSTAGGPATAPLRVSTPDEMSLAARADSGIFHSVTVLGSDHLPVGCELA